MNNFLTRTLSGALYVLIVIGSLTVGMKLFIPVFALVTVLCLWEFYDHSIDNKSTGLKLIGTAAGTMLFLILAYSLVKENHLNSYLPYLFLLTPGLLIMGLFNPNAEHFRHIGLLLLGVLYIAFPLSLMAGIDGLGIDGSGMSPLLGVFILFWTNDTGAYLTGRAFGKRKLFPAVSPGKTWEGLIGGIVLCLGAAYVISLYSHGLILKQWLVSGVIIGLFGTLGDLVESMWKRKLGIKDSGKSMPGHGGLLDRFDGFFIAIPILYFYLFTG